ncbi:hypothetical protein MY494_07620 [Synechococcus sp. A10-1-5-1]|uniref:hypothetical protein n=1 Tax=Synechococcus sp. A10-1-5-1 TaxID=2936507 RepID=UPI002000E33A|nr:hypothetical protein [Synechococcus sp. A10-1-5-1]UPM49221.1 hypothetical protein MY494_07620 [Synechococcus sp. A10-1-5-1]
MSIAVLWVAIAFSLVVICRADWDLLKRGLPSLGLVVTVMYSLTYGLGWTLWRLDPSSLFGYGTASTLGSLDRLALLLALGLPALVCGYSLVRTAVGPKPQEPLLRLAERHRLRLQRLSFALVVLSVIVLLGMTATGLFLRDPQQQQQALQASWIAKLLIGTGLLSRLAPVGLVLLPFAWTGWSRLQRSAVVLLLSSWTALVLGSSSRGQLLALPLYLFLGAVIWRRLPWKRAALLLVLGGLLFLPVAEVIRVQREGDSTNPALQRTFETFQIGKQLMGTTHEFYLLLQASDCSADLGRQLEKDPEARCLLGVPASELADVSSQRWNVVRLFEACSQRELSRRGFSGFESLPLGLIPNTFVPAAPSLFDGQELVQTLSDELGLRPGEISQGTLSLFADAWWRWRWPGVIFVSAALGALLALIQSILLWMLARQPMAGLLGQLLVLSLVGTWVNNTTLTMLWFLLWDLPKAWLQLMLLTALLGFRLPRGVT